MTRTYLIRSAWAFVTLMLAIAGPVLAADPMEEIKQTTDKILSIVTNPALRGPSKAAEREKLIHRAIDERFDWGEMARRALATHWAKRTAEEKKEFVRLFAELLERTYLKKVEDYSGEKVLYEGETKEGDYAAVRVRIITQKDTDIPVQYRLRKKGDDWFIYDVSIEGVSFINNYRTQFNGIVQQSSYENLVKRLREKAELK